MYIIFGGDDLDYLYGINEKGTMYCMREGSNALIENGGGSIVNISSVAGAHGCGGAAYVATKAAVDGLTNYR